MDNAIKIFTITGSIIGIIAFLQNLMKPLLEYNKNKWKRILEIINYEDFDDLERNIEYRLVTWNMIKKLAIFTEMINNDSENLRFRRLIFNFHKSRLNKLLNLYKKFSNLVKEPYWTIKQDSGIVDLTDMTISPMSLNKKEFYNEFKKKSIREIDNIIESHLDEVFNITREMKRIFNKLGKGLD